MLLLKINLTTTLLNMSHIISYDDYRYIVNRKVPFIIYFEDPRDAKNLTVIKIMDEMRITYPLVYCYQVKWTERKNKNSRKINKKSDDVICTKNGRKCCQISAFNTDALHNLFKTVYNDCIINYERLFTSSLRNENKITDLFVHQIYYITHPSYDILPNKLVNKINYKRKRLCAKPIHRDSKYIKKGFKIFEPSSKIQKLCSVNCTKETELNIKNISNDETHNTLYLHNDTHNLNTNINHEDNINKLSNNKITNNTKKQQSFSFLSLLYNDDFNYDMNEPIIYNDKKFTQPSQSDYNSNYNSKIFPDKKNFYSQINFNHRISFNSPNSHNQCISTSKNILYLNNSLTGNKSDFLNDKYLNQSNLHSNDSSNYISNECKNKKQVYNEKKLLSFNKCFDSFFRPNHYEVDSNSNYCLSENVNQDIDKKYDKASSVKVQQFPIPMQSKQYHNIQNSKINNSCTNINSTFDNPNVGLSSFKQSNKKHGK